jgi:chromate transporter
MAAETSQDPVPRGARPSVATLFLAFSAVAISGFGGVMPFARRMLVEQRRWMTADEFNEAYSLAQFLPGGNILNLSVVVGSKFRGGAGALAAIGGLLVGPFLIMIALGAVYSRYGEIEAVGDALAGVAAGAAGLILAMAFRMAEPLARRRALVPGLLALAGFVAIGLFQLPLLPVLAVLAPISVALAWLGWQ